MCRPLGELGGATFGASLVVYAGVDIGYVTKYTTTGNFEKASGAFVDHLRSVGPCTRTVCRQGHYNHMKVRCAAHVALLCSHLRTHYDRVCSTVARW